MPRGVDTAEQLATVGSHRAGVEVYALTDQLPLQPADRGGRTARMIGSPRLSSPVMSASRVIP
jgi:hypothetical protein